METTDRRPAIPLFGDYSLISAYRSQLMGIAMLAIMIFHANHFRFYQPLLDTIKDYGFGGVDLFLMMSGLGVYCSLSRRRDEPYPSYLFRRYRRILPTYWVIVGIYSLWLRMQGRISLTVAAWNLSALHYWFHIPGSFNWYIPALLVFYALAPLFARLLWKTEHKGLVAALAFPLSFRSTSCPAPWG